MSEFDREKYQTPILWRQLKEKLVEDLNNSQLMMCEIEVIIKDLYEQIKIFAEQEYQMAIQQQKENQKQLKEEEK